MIIMNLFYTGSNGKAREFAKEMVSSGLVDKIRSIPGNLGYDYYLDLENPNTLLLIDKWENQEALDHHHKLNMTKIANLRTKYQLTVKAYRYEVKEASLGQDEKYLK